MNIEIWLSFITACMLLCFSPGPTMIMVLGQALRHGKKSVTPLVAGTLSGDVIAMSLSFLGVGAILATSATLFIVIKWVGAFYLFYLGLKAFRSKAEIVDEHAILLPELMQSRQVYFNALLVTALNPKGILFFMAFFPLFLDANETVLPQMLIMAVSFLAASTLSVAFYATFSGLLRNKIPSEKFQNKFNKVSGSMLMGAGVLTATIHK